MNEKICISIPIKSSNLEEIESIIHKALNYNPEFIEFRFDYIPNIDDLNKHFIEQIKDILQRNAYCIFTLRHESEGGKIKIDDSLRFKIIKILIEAKPDFFDIEMNCNTELLSDIINLCYMEKVNLIFSQHNFESTPMLEQAKEIISRFEEKVVKKKIDELNILGKSLYKIIFTAHQIEDNLVPLTLCQEFSQDYKKVISFCMGDMGMLSRLFCIKLGSIMTYASLEEKTAPGQIHIETLQKLYNLLFRE
jgi:3-dehydroquinate dehydratase type I